jgi:hypothetical protein
MNPKKQKRASSHECVSHERLIFHSMKNRIPTDANDIEMCGMRDGLQAINKTEKKRPSLNMKQCVGTQKVRQLLRNKLQKRLRSNRDEEK